MIEEKLYTNLSKFRINSYVLHLDNKRCAYFTVCKPNVKFWEDWCGYKMSIHKREGYDVYDVFIIK